MRIAGFNFKKISVEKKEGKVGKLKINTKIDIPRVEALKPEFVKTRDELIQVDFSYEVVYEPDFAKIELFGTVIIALEPKQAREVLKHWQDKDMLEDVRMDIINVILRKSNVKALELEEEMNLPLHIPFPPLRLEKKQTGE